MDVQMGYDQLRLTPGAWLDLLLGKVGNRTWKCTESGRVRCAHSALVEHRVQIDASPSEGRWSRPGVEAVRESRCRSSRSVILDSYDLAVEWLSSVSETGRGCPTERTSRCVFDLAVAALEMSADLGDVSLVH